MNETTGGSGDGSGDGKAQSRRPKWVGWLVGGSVATLVVVGGLVAVAAFSDVTQGSNDYLIHFETDPVKISKFSAENEAYEREWERQYSREFDRLDHVETDPAVASSFKKEYEHQWERDHGKPYTPQGRETYEDDEVAVIKNLEPSLEPTRLPEDDCTPIRDTITAAPPLPARGSGEVTAAPVVGPAEMDCD